MFEKTKAFCDSFLERGLPGFDLAVYMDGECVLRHMNGYSDLENKVKINGKERYNIYSCSKVITCVCAMMLWEKGLFSLEDKLSDYLPEFSEMTVADGDTLRPASRPILIKHLFEMTAGMDYRCHSPQVKEAQTATDGRCPTRETMKYLAKRPLLFDPGERWEYSLCHDVLAAVVEVIAKEKFEDFARKNIFEPLGMKDSTFMLPEDEIGTVAEQYKFEKGSVLNVGKHIVTHKLGSEYAAGGAGVISTVEDYMKFLEALRTHKLIKPETLALMTTDRLTEEQKKTLTVRKTHGYGLGIRCKSQNGEISDFGWGGAACAYLAVDTEHKLSLYFGAHMLNAPIMGLRSMLYRFVHAELFDEKEFEGIFEELNSLHNYNFTY